MSDNKIKKQNLSTDVNNFLTKLSLVKSSNTLVLGRLIFSLDATSSRSSTWDLATHIQSRMFIEAERVGNLDVQLVYYRGFDQCRFSKWTSSSEKLKDLMNAVSVRAGRTQISKILKHTLNENKRKRINALIFVGDSLEEELDELSYLSGQLGVYGVPIFIFHEGCDEQVSNSFKYLAKLSKGAYFPFDNSSPNKLKDLLGAIGVYATGGLDALIDNEIALGSNVKNLIKQLKES